MLRVKPAILVDTHQLHRSGLCRRDWAGLGDVLQKGAKTSTPKRPLFYAG
jgi:hypothetical protein